MFFKCLYVVDEMRIVKVIGAICKNYNKIYIYNKNLQRKNCNGNLVLHAQKFPMLDHRFNALAASHN